MEKIMSNTQTGRVLLTWMPALFLAISASQASPQDNRIFFHGTLTDQTPGIGDPGAGNTPGMPGDDLFNFFQVLDDGLSNGHAMEMSYYKYDLQMEYVGDAKELSFVDLLDYYSSYAPQKAKLITVLVK
jgi:hypothetical protein